MEHFEDAAVLRFPAGKALVQTLDFFTPIVNDPYAFGMIAAANALSDVYAMGGEPYAAMNIVCFPSRSMDMAVLKDILRGGLDKVHESGALLAGGHSVEDEEIKYGLSVSGIVDPDRIATNSGVHPGDRLILTKPLGTGILATALKAKWTGSKAMEQTLIHWASRLSAPAGAVIRELGLTGATDVTGFGLGGHLLEMARGAGVGIDLKASDVPILEQSLELAGAGLVPEGSHANRKYCSSLVETSPEVDPLLIDCIFDAQTSGGMVLAVPERLLNQAVSLLEGKGELAAVIGSIVPATDGRPPLRIV